MSNKNDYLALKDILFGQESALLDRVRAIVESHDSQIGSTEKLTESVAEVLAPAMKAAGVRNRPGLALAVSPIIIDGIRAEILNSRDEMVDVLYPIMGRLTLAYVMSVVRDFLEKTNRRLESSLSGRFIWLRVYCFLTRKSYAKLLLGRQTGFRIREIMLIHAGTGVLIDTWTAAPPDHSAGPTRDPEPRVTAMLAAINKFAAEALDSNNQSLQCIDLGESQIYMRMTAKLLFAIRCEGFARRSVIDVLNKTILDVLQVYGPMISSLDERQSARSSREALGKLAEKTQLALASQRRKPILAIAMYSLIATVALAYFGWRELQAARAETVRLAAVKVLKEYPGLSGFPFNVSFGEGYSKLMVSGFVPDSSVKTSLESLLRTQIKNVPIESFLLIIPDEQKIERLQQASAAMVSQIRLLQSQLGDTASKTNLEETNRKLASISNAVYAPERRFLEWSQRNAIFFSEGTQFRDEAIATRQMKELVQIAQGAGFKLLLLGYTDTLGSAKNNEKLGLNRAKVVADALVALGVPADRIVTTSRSEEALVTNDSSPANANRRVEFRLAFQD